MDLEQQFRKFASRKPTLGEAVFVAPGAILRGDVSIGDHSSIWFNAVLRADINFIRIGHHSNIQDNCVLHLSDDFPCVIGNYVTVGHGAIVHACTVGDGSLVGMGSTILDGAVIGEGALVGANSLVPLGMKVPPGSVVFGNPARIVRALSPEEQGVIRGYAEKYVRAAQFYKAVEQS